MTYSPVLDISLDVFEDTIMQKLPRTNVVLRSAHNLIKYFSKRNVKFIHNLNSALTYEFGMPIDWRWNAAIPLIRGIHNNEVEVFKNISVDTCANGKIIQGIHINKSDVLRQFRKTYDADILHPIRKNKWENGPVGIKSLKRTIKMSMGRFLAMYTNMQKANDFKDHEMARAASAWYASLAPFSLHISDLKDDWDRAYDFRVGKSCMSNHRSHSATFLDVLPKPAMPHDFYMRIPGVKIASLRRGSRVYARSIVSEKADTKNVFVVRAFGNDIAYNDTLRSMVIANYPERWVLTGEFNVPSVDFEYPGLVSKKSSKDYVFPMPYVDYPRFSVFARFDDDKKVFNIKVVPWGISDDVHDKIHRNVPGYERFRNVSVQSAQGYVKASDLLTLECANCGGTSTLAQARHPVLHVTTRQWVCGNACADSMGFVFAHMYQHTPVQNANQLIRLMDKNDAVKDIISNVYYVDEHNLRLSAGGVGAREGLCDTEDDDYAVSGVTVTINNRAFRVTDTTMRELNRMTDVCLKDVNILRESRFTVTCRKNVTMSGAGATIVDNEPVEVHRPMVTEPQLQV